MKKNKLHPAAELAAYKTGLLKSHSSEKDDEKYMRLAAEFDNYRKRSAKQFADVTKSANEGLILEILDVVDDFQRALDTLSGPENEIGMENCENLLTGMKLIYDKLMGVLKNRGVRPIEALHQPFDPNYHEAVMQSPSDDFEAGTVINVVSPGYMLDDKVIRHSKVVVAS